jgi:very-short-patch-repair endonuclease
VGAGWLEVSLPNENARALRKRLTPHAVRIWTKLRELKKLGFHFRRQAPIGRYIVDFASFGARIAIEVDGGQHNLKDGIELDR